MSKTNDLNTTMPVIIGIDHGYGNIKTAHTCFPTGVTAYDQEPTFKSNLLAYEGRFYIVGDGDTQFAEYKPWNSAANCSGLLTCC